MFPQSIALSGLAPLYKVEADYSPPPKNEFIIKVNGDDYYYLPKEYVDFDPSIIEVFKCQSLKLNGDEAISGSIPWILEEVEDKMNEVYKGLPLESLEVIELDCNSTVVNLFFDMMASQDLKDDSFEALIINKMTQQCFPLEDDVV